MMLWFLSNIGGENFVDNGLLCCKKMFKEHQMLEAIINENIQWKETARQKIYL